MQCLSDEAVLEFVEGRSRADVIARVDEHIATCAACRAVVAETAKFYFDRAHAHETMATAVVDVPNMADGGRELLQGAPSYRAPGEMVGRYQLLHSLGEGGMGVVYAAHDPELGRTVALKLIRADTNADSSHLRERLQREARSMAKLSHPNVVHVYDAGLHDGQVFVAMEFVRGSTLRDWLQAERRSWRAIANTLLQAGDGLVAAHDAGLVHRDFKPVNILCGDDGRVKVTDFGLARPAAIVDGDLARESVKLEAKGPNAGGATLATLTRTGELAGTPAYMALEQLAGKGADARSDQFAFCVSFYEALFGVRPFAGPSFDALKDAVTHGRVAAPKELSSVPPALRTTLIRGLSARPEDRFPSMQELLTEIRQICAAEGEAAAAPARRSRTRAYAFVALGGAALLASLAVLLKVTVPNAPSNASVTVQTPEPAATNALAAAPSPSQSASQSRSPDPTPPAVPATTAAAVVTATGKRATGAATRPPRRNPAVTTKSKAPRKPDDSALKPFEESAP